jgi:hypothetical protein
LSPPHQSVALTQRTKYGVNAKGEEKVVKPIATSEEGIEKAVVVKKHRRGRRKWR